MRTRWARRGRAAAVLAAAATSEACSSSSSASDANLLRCASLLVSRRFPRSTHVGHRPGVEAKAACHALQVPSAEHLRAACTGS